MPIVVRAKEDGSRALHAARGLLRGERVRRYGDDVAETAVRDGRQGLRQHAHETTAPAVTQRRIFVVQVFGSRTRRRPPRPRPRWRARSGGTPRKRREGDGGGGEGAGVDRRWRWRGRRRARARVATASAGEVSDGRWRGSIARWRRDRGRDGASRARGTCGGPRGWPPKRPLPGVGGGHRGDVCSSASCGAGMDAVAAVKSARTGTSAPTSVLWGSSSASPTTVAIIPLVCELAPLCGVPPSRRRRERARRERFGGDARHVMAG